METKKDDTANNTRRSRKLLVAFAIGSAAAICLALFFLTQATSSQEYFTNLAEKQLTKHGIALQAPSEWAATENPESTVLHDQDVTEHDAVALISVSAFEDLGLELDSEQESQTKGYLESFAKDLKEERYSVKLENAEVIQVNNEWVLIGESTETRSHFKSAKKAVNLFLLKQNGEISRVSVMVDEDEFASNKADMHTVIRSWRWL